MDYSSLLKLFGASKAGGAGAGAPAVGGAPAPGPTTFDRMMGAGALGMKGIGEGMMTGRFKQGYNAGAGGMQDLYYAKRAGQEFFGDDDDVNLMERRWQDLKGKLGPAKRGIAQPQGGIS